MKAYVFTHYGPPEVLEFKEIAKPEPNDHGVLIKLCAASVNPVDWHILRGKPFFIRLVTGLFTPKRKVLGSDIAGRVEAVGKNVTGFHPGDAVFGGVGLGGFAEYVCAAEDRLALKPPNLSFEQAASVPVAATTALQGLRDKGRIRSGHRVLVDGASGGVGTFAVQIAKAFGAEVTAVCSTRNVETARLLGADHVIDYTRENFTRNGKHYDLILGANAYHSIFDYRRALAENGTCVKAGGGGTFIGMLRGMLLDSLLCKVSRKKTCGMLAKINSKDLDFLKDLLENKKIVPVIDRRYPFSQAAEAIRYLEEGHARGKVVLTVKECLPADLSFSRDE